MCREGDFPPYEEWNRNGAVATGAAVVGAGDGPVGSPLGVQQAGLSCECGGLVDAPDHLVSLLHLSMVNRKRDLIEDWRERAGWLRQRRLMSHGPK